MKKKLELVMNVFMLLAIANYFADPAAESLRTKIAISIGVLFLLYKAINLIKRMERRHAAEKEQRFYSFDDMVSFAKDYHEEKMKDQEQQHKSIN
ncbi:MAG: hypothetical protein GY834_09920 [Bacteroidetes bacterium]|nr:hypothetical protein [Bacteroidota bacterium]